MDLNQLFDDLEMQMQRDIDAEIENRVQEEERQRQSRLQMRDRIEALGLSQKDVAVKVDLKFGKQMVVQHIRVGNDWWAVHILEPQELSGVALICLCNISMLQLDLDHVAASLGTPVGKISDQDLRLFNNSPRVLERVTISFVLRDLGRRRKNLTILTPTLRLRGVIDRVGHDHLDLTLDNTSKVVVSLAEVHTVLIT